MTTRLSHADTICVAVSSRHDVRDHALAQLGKTFFWVAADALTLFVLIRHDGYAPSTAGWLFLTGLLWNAACDVVVGCWADLRAAAGRALTPVLAAAVPVMGVAFAASLLTPSPYWGWTLFAMLAFRSAFSIFDVPHNAMMTRLALTPAIGLRIANLRTVVCSAASIAVALVSMQLLHRDGESAALQMLSLLSLAAVVLMLPFLSILPRLERLSNEVVPTSGNTTDPASGTPTLGRLCAMTATGTVALAALGKGLMHLDVVHHSWASRTLLAIMLGGLAAMGVVGPAIARLGDLGALRAAYVCATLLILALPFAISSGGTAALTVILLVGLAQGTQLITSWLLLARVVSSSAQNLQRCSWSFGLFTMITKVARGFAGLVLGLLLSGVTATAVIRSFPTEAVMDSPTLWRLCLFAAMGTGLGAFWARVPAPHRNRL